MSRDINLNLIDPDQRNARKHFDEAAITELAQSIKATGLAVPIMVRPTGDRFTIVHGERRYRAITSLGWATIRAEVCDIDDEAASWLALVENLQRADLSPIEEAQAYQAKLASGITQSELGRRLGKTQSYIATKIRFLDLPEVAQVGLATGLISEGHAKQLLRLDDAKATDRIYQQLVDEELSVRKLKDTVDLALRFSEAERALAESLAKFVPPTDDELLEAAHVEAPWSNFWHAEDFSHCESRYYGTVARLIWLFSPATVYHSGFDKESIFIDMAIKNMSRDITTVIRDANLILVNIPPMMAEEDARDIFETAVKHARTNAVIAVRVGANVLDGEHDYSQTSAFVSKQVSLYSSYIVVETATAAERDRYCADVKSGAIKQRDPEMFINCYEQWYLFSGVPAFSFRFIRSN